MISAENSKMVKLFLFIVSLVLFVLIHAKDEPVLGGENDLTADELNSDEIKEKSQKAVKKINEHKINSLPDCVEYEGILNSGTKQVVAGVLYRFKIHIDPKVSDSADCQGFDATVNIVAHEDCKVEVWIKDWENFEQYTVSNCQ